MKGENLKRFIRRWINHGDEKSETQKFLLWIITCNFQEFHVHDMERPKEAESEIIRLENFESEWRKFLFVADPNQPSDGGILILSQEERDELIKNDLKVACCVRRYIGAKDFIRNDEVRYCLWLKDIAPSVYAHNREIMRRLEEVEVGKMRASSTAKPTRVAAETPYKFFSTPQPDAPYLCSPRVSSERRKYIPMAFLRENEIAGDSLHCADLYHFDVLTSGVHRKFACGFIRPADDARRIVESP